MPLDAARDALIALQGQLIVVLAARNAELAARVATWRSGWRGWSVPCRGTPGTPRCRRRLMTCPARTPPPQAAAAGGGASGTGQAARRAGLAPGLERGSRRDGAALPAGGVRVRRGPGRRRGPGGGRLAPGDRDPGGDRDGHPVRRARGGLRAAGGCTGPPRAAGAGAAGTVTYGLEPAGLVRVPDGRARHPGAPVRGADRRADRGAALGRVRARPCSPAPPRRSRP